MATLNLPADILSDILNILNVLLTASILALLVRQWRRTPQSANLRITKFRPALSFIAFYWMAIYIYVAFEQPGGSELCKWLGDCSYNWFGSIFIKPALTMTFATMLSVTIRNERTENARQKQTEDHVPQ